MTIGQLGTIHDDLKISNLSSASLPCQLGAHLPTRLSCTTHFQARFQLRSRRIASATPLLLRSTALLIPPSITSFISPASLPFPAPSEDRSNVLPPPYCPPAPPEYPYALGCPPILIGDDSPSIFGEPTLAIGLGYPPRPGLGSGYRAFVADDGVG